MQGGHIRATYYRGENGVSSFCMPDMPKKDLR